jgi:histidinol dehydrogenase
MKIIKGFNEARSILTREIPAEFSIPSGVKGNKKQSETGTEAIVKQIIADVRLRGDEALYYYAEKLDKVKLSTFKVSRKEIDDAHKKVNQKLLSALQIAADRIANFHTSCKEQMGSGFFKDGAGRQPRPLEKVGLYIPGGTAAYPSTVLMSVIPAKVAGVQEIYLVTPPQKNGSISAPTLVAADMVGVDKIYKVGGAQAIAALAFGTKSIPKVDKICGPGNIFVATAKRLVYGAVDIDGIQGPSEIIVVADGTANPAFCAADLIAQAEHDALASAILITTSAELAAAVSNEIKIQLSKLTRQQIAGKALDSGGSIVIIKNIEQAIELVNLYAPEHLLLAFPDARKYVRKIKNAGCIFLGERTPVAFGDYIAGPSHILPTGGTARFSSPLGIEDFFKVVNIVSLSRQEQKKLGPAVIDIAEAEGLPGHAQAIKIRLQAATKRVK